MKHAFTLIEALAATALAVLLMTAMLHLIVVMSRTNHAMQSQSGPADASMPALWNLLRWDLTNARQYRMEKGALILRGNSDIDDARLLPAHQAVQVSYRPVLIGPRSWLVRVQRSMANVPGRAAITTQLLCPDIQAIDLAPYGDEEVIGSSDADRCLPAAVRLHLQLSQTAALPDGAAPARSSMERIMVLR